jgi:tetratricopeptide (TPR) repeat protein
MIYDEDSNNIKNIRDLIIAYEEIGDVDNYKLYSKIAIQKGCVDTMIIFGKYCGKYGDFENLVKFLTMATKFEDSRGYLYLGEYYESFDIFQAEMCYVCSARAKNYDAIFKLINVYIKTKNFKQADIWYNHLIINNDKHDLEPKEIITMGSYFESNDMYDKAENLYKSVKYFDIDIVFKLGLLYFEVFKNYVIAEQYFDQLIQYNHIGAMYNLGYIKELHEDYDKMIKYYIMAIDCGKFSGNNSSDAAIRLSLYYFKNKKYKLALKYSEPEVEKMDARCMEIVADCSFKLKDYDKLEKYLLMAFTTNAYTRTSTNISINTTTTTTTTIVIDNQRLNMKVGSYYEIIKKNYKLARKYYLLCDNNFSKTLSMCDLVIAQKDKQISCAICAEDFDALMMLNKCCKQILCMKCIRETLNEKYCFSCPFCRKTIIYKNVYILERYGLEYGKNIEDIDDGVSIVNHGYADFDDGFINLILTDIPDSEDENVVDEN